MIAEVYSEPSRTSKMELFYEKAVNNFRKKLNLRCWAGF